MKKKKLLIALVAAVVLIAAVILAPYIYAATLPRKIYTEDDWADYIVGDEMVVNRGEVSIERGVKFSDFICTATVLTDGEERSDDDFNRTHFKMLINNVWFGMPLDRVLDIYVRGHADAGRGIRKGDRVVLFVHRSEAQYAKYFSSNTPYIINPPDDTLFFLAGNALFKDFEGQPPAVLKEHIREIRRELKKEK